MAFYWQIKTFQSRENMKKFLDRKAHKIQWHEVFINNVPGAIEYRDLKIISFK
jgi:hypothetical protein